MKRPPAPAGNRPPSSMPGTAHFCARVGGTRAATPSTIGSAANAPRCPSGRQRSFSFVSIPFPVQQKGRILSRPDRMRVFRFPRGWADLSLACNVGISRATKKAELLRFSQAQGPCFAFDGENGYLPKAPPNCAVASAITMAFPQVISS